MASYRGWTESIWHYLRNPGMSRFPCKYQPRLWFQLLLHFVVRFMEKNSHPQYGHLTFQRFRKTNLVARPKLGLLLLPTPPRRKPGKPPLGQLGPEVDSQRSGPSVPSLPSPRRPWSWRLLWECWCSIKSARGMLQRDPRISDRSMFFPGGKAAKNRGERGGRESGY